MVGYVTSHASPCTTRSRPSTPNSHPATAPPSPRPPSRHHDTAEADPPAPLPLRTHHYPRRPSLEPRRPQARSASRASRRSASARWSSYGGRNARWQGAGARLRALSMEALEAGAGGMGTGTCLIGGRSRRCIGGDGTGTMEIGTGVGMMGGTAGREGGMVRGGGESCRVLLVLSAHLRVVGRCCLHVRRDVQYSVAIQS